MPLRSQEPQSDEMSYCGAGAESVRDDSTVPRVGGRGNGKEKEKTVDEKMLMDNLEELKEEALNPGGDKDIKQIARELLEEDEKDQD